MEQYVKVVNYSSGSELSSAMVGGHININITGADEIMGLIQSGDIVPLISISENRMSTLPDLECTGELGIDSYVGTWRGILCRTDTPDAAVNAMQMPERSMEHPRLSGVPEECLLPRPSRLRRR